MNDPPTAAVIGAGLSGLTAAYRLQQAGWDVEVFESDAEVGGRVRSLTRDGYLLDTGASVLGTSYTAYNALADELGLRAEIVPASPFLGVFRDERIHLLRLDQMIRSAVTTRLISTPSKVKAARLLGDIALAKARGRLDFTDMRKSEPLDTETARDYALRALNQEMDSYLCEPIVRTMTLADTSKVSKAELFSGFANAMSMRIYALRGGLGRMPRALADTLPVTLNAEVRLVSDLGDQVEVHVDLGDTNPTVRRFDAAVIATPVPAAARICLDRASALGPLDATFRYAKTITVAVGTRVAPRTPAMLVSMPSTEDPDIALMFLEHNKCADRAPDGHGLIGAHWETDAAAEWMGRSDDDITQHTLATVLRVFPELRGEVEFTHVTRWPLALPFSSVGTFGVVRRFHAGLRHGDRIQFAGDYLSSAGQNAAVIYGNKAADNLLARSPDQ